MPSNVRSDASSSAATPWNALLRWETSITDMPLPRQSVSSTCACSRTGSGRVAGPAAKLNTRMLALRSCGRHGLRFDGVGLALGIEAFDAFDTGESLTIGEANQPHALRVAPQHRDLINRRAHQRAGRTD